GTSAVSPLQQSALSPPTDLRERQRMPQFAAAAGGAACDRKTNRKPRRHLLPASEGRCHLLLRHRRAAAPHQGLTDVFLSGENQR
ncbi:hypothetical protein RZS08_02610, partial [Arthrospira platensis SPKY1]|nr:hypothetical protein [Arthrospira platensis SPKY1]